MNLLIVTAIFVLVINNFWKNLWWDPMWGISILADFRPILDVSFHTVVVFALGKDFLFKFVLGHCDILRFHGQFLMLAGEDPFLLDSQKY